MKVYVGYDAREDLAYRVAASSIEAHLDYDDRASDCITPLRIERLRALGLLNRPVDVRDGIYDLISNAHCSTQFAISRFLVHILAQSGWALFMDCDMVALANLRELFALADPRYAVMVVKHNHQPKTALKMDGVRQSSYARKNWSSLMLVNCDHPANLRLTVHDVNHRRGLELHQFYWLHDDEIGELPAAWNWLVGEQPMPEVPKIAHFTLGGPFSEGWKGGEHDDIWEHARAKAQAFGYLDEESHA